MVARRFLPDNCFAMGGVLLEKIEELIHAPAPTEASLERTLTDGYALALALEGKRWRLHRELGEVAAGLSDGDSERVRQVSTLARKLAQTDGDLARLRERLAALRRRARDLRALEPAPQQSASA